MLFVSILSFLALSLGRILSSVGDGGYNIGWETYELSFIFRTPIEFIAIVIRTLVELTDTWLYWAIGSLLGELNIPIRMIIIIGFLIIILVASIKQEHHIDIPFKHKMVFILVIIASAGLSMLGMFIAWTPAGSPIITGVQGRYFLPIVPLIILLLRNNIVVAKKSLYFGLVACLCVLQVFAIIHVFEFIIS